MTIRFSVVAIAMAAFAWMPLPARGEVNLVPMGDSITAGVGGFVDGSPGADGSGLSGWRHYLDLMMANAMVDVDFVGTQVDGRDGGDNEHEGYPGFRVKDIGNTIVSNNFGSTLSGLPGDTNIVLLHAGTNDVNVLRSTTTSLFEYFGSSSSNVQGSLLGKIFDGAPSNTHVVVTSIVPILGIGIDTDGRAFDDKRAARDALNAAIPGRIDDFLDDTVGSSLGTISADRVSFFDMGSVLDGTELDPALNPDFSDTLHPSDSGYQKMATAWFDHMATTGLLGGDFDDSGLVDAGDIGALFAVQGTTIPPTDAKFDLVADGVIDDSDVDQLLKLLRTVRGDSDLDRDVDTADLTNAVTNFTGSAGAGKTWSDGDTDGDGDVDTGDLTTSVINFTGALAGGDNVPDLIYDPATGNVTVDADDADVISFSLQGGPFAIGNVDFSDLPAGLTDSVATQIGWTSFNLFSGLTGVAELGAILPTGMDLAQLEAFFSVSTYGLALSGGGGGGPFDLEVLPEPGSAALFGLGALAMLRRRRRIGATAA